MVVSFLRTHSRVISLNIATLSSGKGIPNMLSPRKRQILKERFQVTVDWVLADCDRDWVAALGERIVNGVELAFVAEQFNKNADEIPDIDIDANPLDGDLPPIDNGRWLDHSPSSD